jgi:fatty-acid desaturase
MSISRFLLRLIVFVGFAIVLFYVGNVLLVAFAAVLFAILLRAATDQVNALCH